MGAKSRGYRLGHKNKLPLVKGAFARTTKERWFAIHQKLIAAQAAEVEAAQKQEAETNTTSRN